MILSLLKHGCKKFSRVRENQRMGQSPKLVAAIGYFPFPQTSAQRTSDATSTRNPLSKWSLFVLPSTV